MRRFTSASITITGLLICFFASNTQSISAASAVNTADECPSHCHCSTIIVEQPHQSAGPFLHAKCTTTEGLRSIGKTNSLQSVDCSRIDITKFSTTLDKLTNLTRLDLSQNRLSEVPKLNKRIRVLNLAENQITSAKLTQLPKYVQHLNLSHNELTYLPAELKTLGHLRSIELHGNPINCTCETLQVRNWLAEQMVWTDKVVRCSGPPHWKGLPWLQVKDGDACGDGIDDNELMLGDQPIIDDDGSGARDDNDALDKDYIPVHASASEVSAANVADEEYDSGSGDNEYEDEPQPQLGSVISRNIDGSGDSMIVPTTVNTIIDEDDNDDGSGSGMPLIPIVDRNNFLSETTSEELIEETTRAPFQMSIFNNGVQVHKLDEEDAVTTKGPAREEAIVPGRSASSNNPVPPVDAAVAPETTKDDEASKQTQSTYILLALLGFLLVGLIIFVIFRNKGAAKRRSRAGKHTDAENPPGRELQDMSSKKPEMAKLINGNGNAKAEIVPLMEKSKDEPAATLNGNGKSPAEEPLLNRLNGDNYSAQQQPTEAPKFINENELPHAVDKHDGHTESPVEKPEEYLQKIPIIYNDVPIDDEVFQPVSPKPSRYSPVYSPITGRVKIKLTETPAPRTPMLVTRSRSNAGEIISTPVRPQPNGK